MLLEKVKFWCMLLDRRFLLEDQLIWEAAGSVDLFVVYVVALIPESFVVYVFYLITFELG